MDKPIDQSRAALLLSERIETTYRRLLEVERLEAALLTEIPNRVKSDLLRDEISALGPVYEMPLPALDCQPVSREAVDLIERLELQLQGIQSSRNEEAVRSARIIVEKDSDLARIRGLREVITGEFIEYLSLREKLFRLNSHA